MLSDYYDEVEFAGDKENFGDLAVYIRRLLECLWYQNHTWCLLLTARITCWLV